MKLGVTVGEKANGGWEVLATPDVPIKDQLSIVKSLKLKGGKISRGKKDMQIKRVLFFDAYTKRAKFNHLPVEIVAPPEVEV